MVEVIEPLLTVEHLTIDGQRRNFDGIESGQFHKFPHSVIPHQCQPKPLQPEGTAVQYVIDRRTSDIRLFPRIRYTVGPIIPQKTK